MGYARAGFDIVGVDINSQRRYPFEFVKGDALQFLAEHGSEFDAVHASPPCQEHSALRSFTAPGTGSAWLLEATRSALVSLGRPFVVENVPGAPMRPGSLMLCGSMFGLGADCSDGRRRQLRRHRLFDSSLWLWPSGPCMHRGQPVGVYGHGGAWKRGESRGYKGNAEERRAALDVPWMSSHGSAQAIPPAYTEHIGSQLLAEVGRVAA
jgi:DNA (cytosine-5)-methyltransferase 1